MKINKPCGHSNGIMFTEIYTLCSNCGQDVISVEIDEYNKSDVIPRKVKLSDGREIKTNKTHKSLVQEGLLF